MKIKCPCCNSDKLYFRFEDGFDWDETDQQTVINVDCNNCGTDFLVWMGIKEIIPNSWLD